MSSDRVATPAISAQAFAVKWTDQIRPSRKTEGPRPFAAAGSPGAMTNVVQKTVTAIVLNDEYNGPDTLPARTIFAREAA